MKTMINIIGTMILGAITCMMIFTAAVVADAVIGFTAPQEARFDGISYSVSGGHLQANYTIYKDNTKSLGYAIYETYYAPILSEIEEAF